MRIRTAIKSFVMVAIVGLFLFGCYGQGSEVQPTPGGASNPKPKPTPETVQPATQQGDDQQESEDQ
jgi:hypothetical protein